MLACLGAGLSNAQIAHRLYLSEATVKGYVSRMLVKLECANRTQAGLLAHDAGIAGDLRQRQHARRPRAVADLDVHGGQPGGSGRRASGWLFGLQFADHLQRVADVLADVGHGVEDVPDRALAVDHIGDPARQQAEHRRYP